MTDTQPCITEGERIRSQRHTTAACPMRAAPEEDVTERHLLVTLPYLASVDPDRIGDLSGSPVGDAMESIRLAFEEEPFFAEGVSVTQVYPGDVVEPDAVPDEQPDAVTVVEDPAPAHLSMHVSPAHNVAADLLVAALTALNVYRDHCSANALGRHGMNDLHMMDELADRSDLITSPRHAVACILAEGGRVPMNDDDTSESQWWSDTVADLAGEHYLLED